MDDQAVLEERYEILKKIFGNVYYNRKNDEVVVFCPKHHHHKRKLSINIRKNAYRCWVCGYGGNYIYFLLNDHAKSDDKKRYLSTLGINLKSDEFINSDLKLPEEYKFALENFSSPVGSMAVRYLFEELKLSKNIVLQNKIGFCEEGKYENRVVFPSFDAKGNLNYFITRRIDGGDYKKYLDCEFPKSGIIYNELFLDWSKPIILVESVKCYLRHFCVPNVVPIMGTTIKDDYRIFEEIIMRNCKNIFVILDKEAKIQALNILQLFQSYNVNVRLGSPEIQPENMTTNQFVDTILSSKNYDKEDILKEKLKIL